MSRSNVFAVVFPFALALAFIFVPSLQAQGDGGERQAARPEGFIYRDGSKLMLNGKPYQTASFNSFQLSGCGHEYEVFSDAQINSLFASLPDNILIRTWAFPGGAAKIGRVI